ncbi:MAG TPA: hypothetical protein VM694_06705, partial [Polyangium sp.]|nr:hypothetical protein [Polyangium sp.]
MGFAQRALVGITSVALALAGAGCRRPPSKKDKPLPQAPPSASTEPLTTPSAAPDADEAPAGSAAPVGSAAPAGSAALAGGGSTTKRKPKTGARFLIDGPEQPIAVGGAATVFSKGIVWRLSGNAAQVTLFGPDGPAPGPSEPERARKWPRGKV